MTRSTGLPSEPQDGPPSGLALTALDARFREDPYPVLVELRAREPVHRDEILHRVVLTRHDDVQSVLRDLELWSDPSKGNPGSFARDFLTRGDETGALAAFEAVAAIHPNSPGARQRIEELRKRVLERGA